MWEREAGHSHRTQTLGAQGPGDLEMGCTAPEEDKEPLEWKASAEREGSSRRTWRGRCGLSARPQAW